MSDLQQKEAMSDCTEEVAPAVEGLLESIMKRAACTALGQSVLKQADRLLWTAEKCAQWAMPQTKVEDEAGKLGYRPELVRPLPWVLFLPALIALRALRVGLSLILLLLGKHPLQPATMVRFIQDRRRRLRAIKFHGCRAIRMQRQAASGRSYRSSLLRSLSGLVSSAICVRHPIDEPQETVVENSVTQTSKDCVPPEKRKFVLIESSSSDEDISEEEEVEGFLDMVERLAAISDGDVDEDPDYEIGAEYVEELSDEQSGDDGIEPEEEPFLRKNMEQHGEKVLTELTPEQLKQIIEEESRSTRKGALPANTSGTQNTNGTMEDSAEEDAQLTLPQLEEGEISSKAETKIAQNGRSSNYKEDYRPLRLRTKVKPAKESSPLFMESEQRAQTLSVETDDQFYSPVSSSCASPEPSEITKLIKAEQQTNIETGRIELPPQESRV